MALSLGSSLASKIYLGSTEVALAYLGATQVYSAASHLLDQYPGAAAAYSLRALSSGWVAGDVVRARRVNTPGEANFTAGQVANGELATWALSGDAFVTTWYDQSGNANNATQATTTAQPKIVDAGALVVGGLDFDGVNDKLKTSNEVTNGGDVSMFSVRKVTSDASFNVVVSEFRASDSQKSYTLGLTSTNRAYSTLSTDGSTSIEDLTASANLTESLQTLINDGSNGIVNLDGSQETSITTGSLFDSSAPLIIGNVDGGGAWFSGSIAEIIVYDSDKSSTRFGIEANMRDKYSLFYASVDTFNASIIASKDATHRYRDPSSPIFVNGYWYVYCTRYSLGGPAVVDGEMFAFRSTNLYASPWESRGVVLTYGGSSAFDEKALVTPEIVVDSGNIYMFYSGSNTSNARRSIGLATAATTSPESFTKSVSNPILTNETDGAGVGAWADGVLDEVHPVKESNGTWTATFKGKATAGEQKIGTMTATAIGFPESWTYGGSNPVIDSSDTEGGSPPENPALWRNGAKYQVGLTETNADFFTIMESSDLLTWTKNQFLRAADFGVSEIHAVDVLASGTSISAFTYHDQDDGGDVNSIRIIPASNLIT